MWTSLDLGNLLESCLLCNSVQHFSRPQPHPWVTALQVVLSDDTAAPDLLRVCKSKSEEDSLEFMQKMSPRDSGQSSLSPLLTFCTSTHEKQDTGYSQKAPSS